MRYFRLTLWLAGITSGLLTAVLAAPSPARAAVNKPVPAVAQHAAQPLLRALTARLYTVRPGDTLAAIAVRYCGHPNDWTGIWTANKTVIGADPNLIVPGQQLHITVCTDPPALLRLGSTWHATRHPVQRAVRHAGRTWGVAYGYPNRCGDGDGDGWDVACTARNHAPSARPAFRVVSAARSYAGTYSYAGLEALWRSAGGPSWAAYAAAAVAECESGGNVYAHNPSGATGLWQILGSVVGGNLYNPYVNALNAVAKFRGGGDTWAAWVCKP